MPRIIFSLLLACSGALFAQECTTYVPVSAFDAKTKGVLRGLSAGDFSARTDKSGLQVSRATPIFHNRVLVLVDAGDSIANASSRDELNSIAELASSAPPEMPVAFGVFAQHAVFTHGFLTRPEDLGFEVNVVMEKVQSMQGPASIPAALRQGLALFGAHQSGDTVLLITNGTQRLRRHEINELSKEFWRKGTRLVLLSRIQPSAGGTQQSLFDSFTEITRMDSGIIELAKQTGGALMGFMTTDWFNVASDGYILALASPAAGEKPFKLSISMTDSSMKADLFYPQKIRPCSGMLSAAATNNRLPQ